MFPSQSPNVRPEDHLCKPAKYTVNIAEIKIPTTFREATSGPDADRWWKAIHEEIEAHERNGTWDIVPRQKSTKIIKRKWVFKVINNQSTGEARFKARLVGKGFMQEEGIDYSETYAPIERYDSLRVLLAYITQEDMEMVSFNVCAAFMYGDLEEEIWMEVPEGVQIKSEDSGSVVCQLLKALYGLKQAPRCWNVKFSNFLRRFSFKECEADNCVYVRELEGHTVYLALFVDDGLLASKSSQIIDKILSELRREYSITVGDASYFVGLQIKRNRTEKSMFINQSAYTQDVLSKYGMSDAKYMSVPDDPNVHLLAADPDCKGECKAPYREAIGSLP